MSSKIPSGRLSKNDETPGVPPQNGNPLILRALPYSMRLRGLPGKQESFQRVSNLPTQCALDPLADNDLQMDCP